MKKNELRALLAVTVIAVPLVFTTGCGKKTEAPADTVVTETVTETPIPETIEEDLADEGIEVTPTPEAEETLDESMAGTYYVISEDGIPAYGENDPDSEVVETIPYDTEVTVLGMSTETSLFKVQLTDSTEANSLWVSSEFLDTVRGGLQDAGGEVAPPAESADSGTGTGSGSGASYEDEEWFQALTPEEQEEYRRDMEILNGGGGGVPDIGATWDEIARENGWYDDGTPHEGTSVDWGSVDGSGLQTGVEIH